MDLSNTKNRLVLKMAYGMGLGWACIQLIFG